MLQSMSSKAVMHDVTTALENTQIIDGSDSTIKIPYQHNSIIHKRVNDPILDLYTNTNNSEHCDEGFHQFEQIGDESEFQGIEFENLVLLEGP